MNFHLFGKQTRHNPSYQAINCELTNKQSLKMLHLSLANPLKYILKSTLQIPLNNASILPCRSL